MPTSNILQLGFLSGTDFFGYWTAWMEPATEGGLIGLGTSPWSMILCFFFSGLASGMADISETV
jgi:hypothetical protein